MSSSTFTAEVREIRDHISACEPFRILPSHLLIRAAGAVVVKYVRAGATPLEIGDHNNGMYLIVRGAAELRNEDDALIERLGEGDSAGVTSAVTGQPARSRCVIIEDSILYSIPGEALSVLRRESQEFDRELIAIVEHRLIARQSPRDGYGSSLMIECRSLMTRSPVTIDPSVSAAQAARTMTENRVSSLIITDRHGRPVGMLTDRDIRARVLAEELDAARPVADFMTDGVITIRADRSAHEALLLMGNHGIHHLPVVEPGDGVAIGMISSTDLLMARSLEPVFFVNRLAKADTVEQIVESTAQLPRMIEGLLAADAQAEVVGRLVTGVTDGVSRRLCELAEDALGPPPMPYAFVCFGSQARQEQTAFTDQDNAMILASEPDESAAQWFRKLAEFVCNGLAAAGYRYCPGEIMATNPRWRVSLDNWESYVSSWVIEPDPEAVLNASVFFDARHLHGDESLTDRYLSWARKKAGNSQLFLGQLAANASEFRPPLGFFRRFVVEKNGDHLDRIDMKRHGVTPVVELARVYALESGVQLCNTWDRLRATSKAGGLAPSDATDLAVALEHVGYFRLQHQRRQIERGETPDNHMEPNKLSRLEQEQLRRAFVAIDRLQDAMRRHFRTSDMG